MLREEKSLRVLLHGGRTVGVGLVTVVGVENSTVTRRGEKRKKTTTLKRGDENHRSG
jgi:hypothetical protein